MHALSRLHPRKDGEGGGWAWGRGPKKCDTQGSLRSIVSLGDEASGGTQTRKRC